MTKRRQTEWANAFPRIEASGFTPQQVEDWIDDPGHIAELDDYYGKDLWGLFDALDKMGVPPLQPRRNETQKPPTLEERAAVIVQWFTDHYDNIDQNDLARLKELAQATIAIEEFHRLLNAELSKPEGGYNEKKVNSYRLQIEKFSAQILAIQRALGIDRSTRQKEKDKGSLKDEVMREIDQAVAFVENEAIELTHCHTLWGMLFFDFAHLPFKLSAICPKCGKRFWIHHVPTEEQVRVAQEPPWVAEEEGQVVVPALAVQGDEENTAVQNTIDPVDVEATEDNHSEDSENPDGNDPLENAP